MGGNRHCQAKHAKIQTFVLSTTAAIPTKFCTLTKTIMYSLWAVPKFATQIQNGGWPPSWKKINCHISATVLPTHTGNLNPNCCSKNEMLTNPRQRMAAIFKNVITRYLHNLLTNFIKSGMVMHVVTPNYTVYQKFKNLRIPHGGSPPL